MRVRERFVYFGENLQFIWFFFTENMPAKHKAHFNIFFNHLPYFHSKNHDSTYKIHKVTSFQRMWVKPCFAPLRNSTVTGEIILRNSAVCSRLKSWSIFLVISPSSLEAYFSMLATQEAQVMPLIVTKHFSYSPASSTFLLKATVLPLISRSLAERARVLEGPEWLAISWLLLSPSATHRETAVYSADHHLYWLSHILSYGASPWETAGWLSPGSSSAHLQQMIQTTRARYSALLQTTGLAGCSIWG